MFANQFVSFSLFCRTNLVCNTGFLTGRDTIFQLPSSLQADISLCIAALQRFNSPPFKASLTSGSWSSSVRVIELILNLVGACLSDLGYHDSPVAYICVGFDNGSWDSFCISVKVVSTSFILVTSTSVALL